MYLPALPELQAPPARKAGRLPHLQRRPRAGQNVECRLPSPRAARSVWAEGGKAMNWVETPATCNECGFPLDIADIMTGKRKCGGDVCLKLQQADDELARKFREQNPPQEPPKPDQG